MRRVLSPRLRAAAVVALVAGAGLVAPVALAAPAAAVPAAGATGYAVTATIPVGTTSTGGAANALAVNAVSGRAYAADVDTGTVSVIDTATNAVTATIDGDATPLAVAVDTARNLTYVVAADPQGQLLTKIDGATNTVLDSVDMDSDGQGPPFGVAVYPTNGDVYATHFYGSSVSVIDGASLTTKAVQGVGSIAFAVAVDPTTGEAVVTSLDDGVRKLDANHDVTAAAVAPRSNSVAIDAGTRTVYVGDEVSPNGPTSQILVLDEDDLSVRSTIDLPAAPRCVALDPGANRLYVGLANGTVGIIDTATDAIIGSVAVGVSTKSVTGMAVDVTTHAAYALAAQANGGTGVAVIKAGPVPTVTAVSPTAGSTAGRTSVTITGTDFTGTSSVRFGTAAARSFTVDSATQITAVAPAGSAGTVDITVTTPFGTSPTGRTDRFDYVAPPTVTSVAPSSGVPGGGQQVIITGTSLTSATAVSFGGAAATSFTVDSATSITAVAPAGTGTVNVAVTTPFGTGTLAGGYTYAKATPTLTTTSSTGTAAGGSISDTANVVGGASPSGTVTFTLYGPGDTTCSGTPVTTVTDGVSNGSAASGAVTVTRAGTYRWTASYSGDGDNTGVSTRCGDATVVTAAAPDRIVISPATASITAGGSQAYTAGGFDAYDNSLGDVTADTTFTIAGGTCAAATCTPSTTASSYTVTGTDGSATGTATLTVTTAALDHIVVSPATASIAAGGSQAYTAEGFDAYDNSLGDVTANTTFTINGGTCAAAVCTPSTTAGDYTVTGTDGAFSDTASLTVTAAGLDHLVVTPATASITAGGSQTYSAEGFDAFDNSLGDVTADTTFTISGAGSCTGAECTSTVAGDHTVTGTAGATGSATGTATLTVTAAGLDHLVLAPANASITAGGSQAYTAEAFDRYGNTLGDATADTTFTIDGGGSCSGATCTSTVAGGHTVTGTDGAVTGFTTLTVNPATLDRLVLSAATATVTAGGTQAYTARGIDAYGNNLGDVTADTTFTIDGGGTCSGATCTPSTTAGTYTVTGTDGSATGTATLTVTAAGLDHITLAPATASVTAGGSQTYTAEGFDAFGNSRGDVTRATRFTITTGSGAAGGTCRTAVCTPSSRVGTYTVTGTNGSVTATASLTVTVGALNRVVVSPGSATAQAGQLKQFTAEGFDRFGNSRGDVTGPATFTIGGVDDSDASCSGSVCTSTVAGVYTVTATVGAVSGTTRFRVTVAAIRSVAITSATGALTAGQSKTYVVRSLDRYGNSGGIVTADARFSGSAGVTCTGATCSATKAGYYTVTVKYAGKAYAVQLRVIPAGTASITVTSATGAIVAGSSKTYVVRAFDTFGNSRGDVTPAATFVAGTGASCTGATCTAPTAGRYPITVTYADRQVTVTLVVTRGGPGGPTS